MPRRIFGPVARIALDSSVLIQTPETQSEESLCALDITGLSGFRGADTVKDIVVDGGRLNG